EVARELCVLRLDGQRSDVAAERRRQIALLGRRFRARCEMLRDISARAEKSLLLAAPEADADPALRLNAQGFEHAHDFHRHQPSSAIVGRASAAVPPVEMSA